MKNYYVLFFALCFSFQLFGIKAGAKDPILEKKAGKTKKDDAKQLLSKFEKLEKLLIDVMYERAPAGTTAETVRAQYMKLSEERTGLFADKKIEPGLRKAVFAIERYFEIAFNGFDQANDNPYCVYRSRPIFNEDNNTCSGNIFCSEDEIPEIEVGGVVTAPVGTPRITCDLPVGATNYVTISEDNHCPNDPELCQRWAAVKDPSVPCPPGAGGDCGPPVVLPGGSAAELSEDEDRPRNIQKQ